jgi:hypothetical protein
MLVRPVLSFRLVSSEVIATSAARARSSRLLYEVWCISTHTLRLDGVYFHRQSSRVPPIRRQVRLRFPLRLVAAVAENEDHQDDAADHSPTGAKQQLQENNFIPIWGKFTLDGPTYWIIIEHLEEMTLAVCALACSRIIRKGDFEAFER